MKSRTNFLNVINMSTTEKLNAVLEAINKDIAQHRDVAKHAMLVLEHMNVTVTDEEYKEANLCFGLNQFIVGYLTHIKETIAGMDIKSVENLIRFHAYNQHTKGNITDGSNISIGQAAVATLLGGYITKFFED